MDRQATRPGLGRRAALGAFVLGAVSVLVPLVPVVSGLLLWFFPPIGVGVLALWAWETRRRWRQGRISARRWAAITWFLFVGPLWMLVTIAFLPPGAGLPEGDDAVPAVGAMLAVTVAGSALLAVTALWAGVRLAGVGRAEPPVSTAAAEAPE